MGLQQEEAVLNVQVNGQQAKASIDEMNEHIKYLTKSITAMHQADNPTLYASRVAQLRAVTAARDAERAAINNTTAAVKQQAAAVTNSFGAIKSAIAGVGAFALVGLLKGLVEFESKASGIEQAFSKIGKTEGLLEKMRVASRGLISDLDLEKIAIKANNANIPMEKMGTFLAFASQRARDTGEDVTTLTEKLITGLGKGGTRSLAALGISVKEIKTEFKKTGDMVEAVSNIIAKQMQRDGEDVETFGDKVKQVGIWFQNLLKGGANILGGSLFGNLASPEAVEAQKDKELKAYDGYEKFNKEQLNKAIKQQEERVAKFNQVYKDAEAKSPGFFKRMLQGAAGIQNTDTMAASISASTYQGAKNALAALQHQLEVKSSNEDAENQKKTKKDPAEKEAEAALKKFQELAQERRQFEAADLSEHMAKNQKEIQEEKNKYDILIQKEQEFLKVKGISAQQRAATVTNITQLEAEKETAVAQLRVKQEKELTDKISEFRRQMSGKLETELQRQTDAINKEFAKMAEDAAGNAAELKKIEEGREHAIVDAQQREIESLKEMKRKLQEDNSTLTGDKDQDSVAAINKKYDNEVAAFKKAHDRNIVNYTEYIAVLNQLDKNRQAELAKHEKEQQKQELDLGIQTAETIASAAFQIAANNRQAEEQAQMTMLERQRQNDLNNHNLTQSQKDAINARYDEQERQIKKQAWEADKEAQLEQAIIAGALAVVKALPNPFLAAAAGIAAAAQVAIIESQPTPQFAQGGFLPDGPGHANGGINLVGNYGRVLGNIEGGEPILSRATYANNRGLVNALLASKGGPVDYERINQATMGRDLRRTGSAAGSITTGGSVTPGQSVDLSELVQEMRLTRVAFEQKQLTINRRAWDIEADRVTNIRSNASA